MQPNYGTFCAGGDYAIGSVNNSNAAKTVTSAVFDDRRLFPKLRGREMQAELFADELTEISDNGSNDWMERTNKTARSRLFLSKRGIGLVVLSMGGPPTIAKKLGIARSSVYRLWGAA